MTRPVLLPLLVVASVLLIVESLAAQPPARAPRRVALLVGPKEYLHDFTTLPHLDDDVTALAAELRKAGFDEVVVLTDKPEGKRPATRKNILDELSRLLSGGGDASKAIRKDDVVLLALSGHGQEAFADGKTKDTFFAPVDGKKKDTGTLVKVADVLDQVSGCGCRTLILADMCRDVFDPNKGKGVDIDNLKLPKNAAILFGCESTQQSFVNTELKHSLFTYAVLEVLREANAAGRPLLWSQLVSGVELKFGSDEFKKYMGAERQQSPVERKTDLKATALTAAAPPPKGPKPAVGTEPPPPPAGKGRARVTAAQVAAYTDAAATSRDPIVGILTEGDVGTILDQDDTEKMVKILVTKDGKQRQVWVSLSSVDVTK